MEVGLSFARRRYAEDWLDEKGEKGRSGAVFIV